MEVSPVPAEADILWPNAQVSKATIKARRRWVNMLMLGLLFLWSMFVALIRSEGTRFSKLLPITYKDGSSFQAVLDTYMPIAIIEGCVRVVPEIMRVLTRLSRFKTQSSIDLFIFRWYFFFRLMTFVFVIVGGSLVSSTEELVDSPLSFLERLAREVPKESQYFTSYVIIATGFSPLFYMSQITGLVKFWLFSLVSNEAATSSRKLDEQKTNLEHFSIEELVPLFIFAFMVGLLYGMMSPFTLIFVSAFFRLCYKVFRFMVGTIYITTEAISYWDLFP